MPGSRSGLLLSLIRPLLLCYLIYKSLETAAPLTLYPSPLNPQPLDPKELKYVANNFYYQDARSSYRELPYTTNTVLSQLIFSSNTTMRDIAPTTFFTHRQKFPHLESKETEMECHDWNPMPQWQDDHYNKAPPMKMGFQAPLAFVQSKWRQHPKRCPYG